MPNTITSPLVAAAAALHVAGCAIVWLRPGKKRPWRTGWTTSSQKPEGYRPGENLGLLCGRLSGDLVCVDIDAAGAANQAHAILPATSMIDGRPGKPVSHWWYRVTDVPPELEVRPKVAGGIGGPRTAQFRDPKTKRMVLEFKGTGAQVVVPPSLWTGDGGREERLWYGLDGEPVPTPGEPAVVDCRELFDRVHELAVTLGGRPARWVLDLMAPPAEAPEPAAAVEPRPPAEAGPPGDVLLIPPTDRVDVARVVMGHAPSARSGRGGHATTYRLARALVNDCALTREQALELLREYNQRLGREGEETWTEAELAHKVDSALAAAADPRFPYGSKVRAEAVTNPHRLAREFLAGRPVRYWRDLYWEYDGQKYVQVADKEMKALLTGHLERRFAEEYAVQVARYQRRLRAWQADPRQKRPLPPRLMGVRAPLLRDVTLALNDEALLRGTVPMPCLLPQGITSDYLAVANGLLDLENGTLRPHTPNWFSGVCLPYPYEPGAAAPQWLAFLQRNLEGDGDRIALLQQFFGYCLARTTDGQACLILHGLGANGKSVVLAVLRGMLGADNVATVPLEKFDQRFAMAQTLGKLANVCPEVGELDKTAEGTLKSYIAGDAMFFEKKNKDGFTAPPSARLVIATNNIPRFVDRSEGIWRRLLILPMTVQILDAERTAGMDKEAYWVRSGALPGVLNWALEGLRRLRAGGWRFTRPAACNAALEEHRRESDPARTFLLDYYEAAAGAEPIVAEELYLAYTLWCDRNGHRHPLNNISFGKQIRRLFSGAESRVVYQEVGVRRRCWSGLRAVGEATASPGSPANGTTGDKCGR
jgi:P4 family phage/plasmid primase-like protien